MDPTTKEGREAISLKLQGQEAAAKMGHSKRPDAWQAAALSHIEKLEAERSIVRSLCDEGVTKIAELRTEHDELRAEVETLRAVIGRMHQSSED